MYNFLSCIRLLLSETFSDTSHDFEDIHSQSISRNFFAELFSNVWDSSTSKNCAPLIFRCSTMHRKVIQIGEEQFHTFPCELLAWLVGWLAGWLVGWLLRLSITWKTGFLLRETVFPVLCLRTNTRPGNNVSYWAVHVCARATAFLRYASFCLRSAQILALRGITL